MDQHHGQVVEVDEVVQLHGEVHVPRDEDHRGGGGVGVGEPPQGLAQLVISSILRYGVDMDQRDLRREGGGRFLTCTQGASMHVYDPLP